MKLLFRFRGGFHAYCGGRNGNPERAEKLACVRRLAETSDHTYGSRRMAKGLRAPGYAVGRHQARGLMREAGIRVRYRRRYRVTTDSRHAHPVFPNPAGVGFPCVGPEPGLDLRHRLRLDP